MIRTQQLARIQYDTKLNCCCFPDFIQFPITVLFLFQDPVQDPTFQSRLLILCLYRDSHSFLYPRPVVLKLSKLENHQRFCLKGTSFSRHSDSVGFRQNPDFHMSNKHPRQQRIASLTNTPSKVELVPNSFDKSVVSLQSFHIPCLGLGTEQGHSHPSPVARPCGEQGKVNLIVRAKPWRCSAWRGEEKHLPAIHSHIHFLIHRIIPVSKCYFSHFRDEDTEQQ